MYPMPMERWTERGRWVYCVSIIVVLVMWLLPLIVISLASFMTADQLNAGGRGLKIPNPLSIDGYRTALASREFFASIINSFMVVLPVTFISVALATLAGYGLSKFRIPGRTAFFVIVGAVSLMILSDYNIRQSVLSIGSYGPWFIEVMFGSTAAFVRTLIIAGCLTAAIYGMIRTDGNILLFALFVGGNFVPFQILMVPVMRVMQDLGIYNTAWALVVFHGAFQTGFCVFFMRNFISQLPNELIESGRVEGANELQIFWFVILPLVKPATAALAVLIFTFVWNDFFWSLVLTPASPDGMLAPAALNNVIKGRFYNSYNVLAAGSILVALPPVLMFFVLQKQFIAGLTLGANKG